MLNYEISIVIPVYNEVESLDELVRELEETLTGRVSDFEVILVNDASTDGSEVKLKELSQAKSFVKVYENSVNLGQGETLFSGITKAQFPLVVTMDGDLQVDPSEIIKILVIKDLKKLDFVCSKRKKRADETFKRHIPSVLGNILISSLYNTDFSDIGSPLKVIDRKHLADIKPFRNIHRYLNIILSKKNLSYEEVPVEDRYRKHGSSKYSTFKFLLVLFELFKLKIYLKKNILK